MRKLEDAEAEANRERACTYLDREVRQGASLVVTVPGATADHLPKVTSASRDLVGTPRLVGGTVVVDIKAVHGAALGDIPDHKVTIAATIAGREYKRELLVLVQAIAASPEGDDDAVGSERKPFRTFRKAASVAETGDTIFLRNTANGEESEPDERAEILIPPGVTVRGQVPSHGTQAQSPAADAGAPRRANGTILGMPIRLAGSARLDNLALTQRLNVERLEATEETETTVLLNDVDAFGGITVAKSASNATLKITGGSHVHTDATPYPVLVEAADATLSLDGDTSVEHGDYKDPPGTTPIEAPVLKLAGPRQHLDMGGNVRVQGLKGPVAIQMDDAQTVEITGREKGSLRILGRVDITGYDTMVTATNVTFSRGIGGSGISFKGMGDTSSMRIEHCSFGDEGIVIDGAKSTVTVRDTVLDGITKSGIRLVAGTLDLGTKLEAGHNTFVMKDDPELPLPVGLQVDAEVGQARVTSSATTYGGFDPGRCDVTGPVPKESIVRGFVKIAHAITIEFFP